MDVGLVATVVGAAAAVAAVGVAIWQVWLVVSRRNPDIAIVVIVGGAAKRIGAVTRRPAPQDKRRPDARVHVRREPDDTRNTSQRHVSIRPGVQGGLDWVGNAIRVCCRALLNDLRRTLYRVVLGVTGRFLGLAWWTYFGSGVLLAIALLAAYPVPSGVWVAFTATLVVLSFLTWVHRKLTQRIDFQ